MRFVLPLILALAVVGCPHPQSAPTTENVFITTHSAGDVLTTAESMLREEGYDEIKSDVPTGTIVAHRKRIASEAGPQVRCDYSAAAASTRDTDLSMRITAVAQGDSTTVTISSSVLASDQAPTALGVTRSRSRTDCRSALTTEGHLRDSLEGHPKS